MKFRLSRSISILYCFDLLLCTVAAASAQVINNKPEDFNNSFFISEIFNKYGDNKSMTFEGFEHLLENLGLGKLTFEANHDVSIHKVNGTFVEVHDKLLLHRHNHSLHKMDNAAERIKRNLIIKANNIESKNFAKSFQKKCLTPQDILLTFGLQPHHNVIISPEKYLQICPAIIYELDQKLCETKNVAETLHEPKHNYLVWVYASISIFIMGASGMLCVLIVPVVKNHGYSYLIQFLVSLAVGTLCGDALIHLIPQVFQQNIIHRMSIFKGAIAVLAIFLFFVIENILKEVQKKKVKNSTSNKEMGLMLSEISCKLNENLGHHNKSKDIKTLAWMAIIGDILHNVTDGLSIGAAFSSRLSSGFASSIAIFCHELPHELGDYVVLLESGMSVKKSLFYNFLSSVFSFLGMTAGILLGEINDASLWINAFTAGSFLYIAISDLLPDLRATTSNMKQFFAQICGICSGGILMCGIAFYEDKIEEFLC